MKLTKRDKRTPMEKLIDEQLEYLMYDAQTPMAVAEVIDLVDKRQKLKDNKRNVSPDTIAIIAGNLLGIGLILGYEKLNVISTKALGFIIRARV